MFKNFNKFENILDELLSEKKVYKEIFGVWIKSIVELNCHLNLIKAIKRFSSWAKSKSVGSWNVFLYGWNYLLQIHDKW